MAFGETRTDYPTGSVPTDRRFTGQREENGLGSLYDYGARFYSPYLNRWLSPDTIVPDFSNPQSLNRFSYVLNNPLRYTDPSGHCIPGQPGCQEDDVPNVPNPYGINFTSAAGVAWDVRDQNAVFGAAQNIATSLRQSILADRRANAADYRRYGEVLAPVGSAPEVFQQAFGQVTFHRNAGNCGNCWARADDPWGTVQVHIQNVGQGRYTAQNAAHELGHTFDWRTGFQARADLTAEWNANQNFPRRDPNNIQLRGYAGRRFTWQQSNSGNASEEFADMFLGWAYNRWENSAAGRTRSQWMTGNMPGWIALAVSQ